MSRKKEALKRIVSVATNWTAAGMSSLFGFPVGRSLSVGREYLVSHAAKGKRKFYRYFCKKSDHSHSNGNKERR